jgi:hypothetical protein
MRLCVNWITLIVAIDIDVFGGEGEVECVLYNVFIVLVVEERV